MPPTVDNVASKRYRICRILFRKAAIEALFVLAIAVGHTKADKAQMSDCELRHPMGDAWWTGPLLANTAATALADII